MNKVTRNAVLAAFAAFSVVPVAVHAGSVVAVSAHAADAGATKASEGKMVYAANGQRLAPVYRVNADGSVQLIMEGKLVTIPAAVLTEVNGKLTASENKGDLMR